MDARYANPEANKRIRQTQISKLRRQYPGVWKRTAGVSSVDRAFLQPRKSNVTKVRKVKLTDLNFLETFVFFYGDGTAELILTTHGKGTNENEKALKENDEFLESLELEKEHIPRIFYLEGLSVPVRSSVEEMLSYKEIFQILSTYLSSLSES